MNTNLQIYFATKVKTTLQHYFHFIMLDITAGAGQFDHAKDPCVAWVLHTTDNLEHCLVYLALIVLHHHWESVKLKHSVRKKKSTQFSD